MTSRSGSLVLTDIRNVLLCPFLCHLVILIHSLFRFLIHDSYIYSGNTVASPALLSLPSKWSKAAFGIALGNFLVYVFLTVPIN